MDTYDDINLMTQQQLADKYHVDATAISSALAMANVPPATVSKALSKKPRKLYDEKLAVMALTKLYQRRKENHMQTADEWQARIDRINHIYEFGEE